MTAVNSGAMKIGMCVSFRVVLFTGAQHHSSEMRGCRGPSGLRFARGPRNVCLRLPLLPSPARAEEDSLFWTSQAALALCASLGWWPFWWVGAVGASAAICLDLPISDADYLPTCFCGSCSESPVYLSEADFLSVGPVLSSSLMIIPGRCLRAGAPYSPRSLVNEEPTRTGFHAVVAKSRHKGAACLPAPPPPAPSASGKALPRWCTGVPCAEAPRACVPQRLPCSHPRGLQHPSAEGCGHPQEGVNAMEGGQSGIAPCFPRSHGTQGTSRCSSRPEAPRGLGS